MSVSREEFNDAKAEYSSLSIVASRFSEEPPAAALPSGRKGLAQAAGRWLRQTMLWMGGQPQQVELIECVSVRITGIRGSSRSRMGVRRTVVYECLIDTSHIRGSSIPVVWVHQPPDEKIQHVNIWRLDRSEYCRWLSRTIPSLCWGSYEYGWAEADAHQRTLGALLEYIKQFLQEENHDSPAR
jgi:hypothetical protein